jgi:hypothetical protein
MSRQRGETPRDNHGLHGHSFQPSVQMEMANCADSSARICLRKIAFGSESPLPQPSGRVAVAAAVKIARGSHRGGRATAASSADLSEERRKVRGDHGSEAGGCRLNRRGGWSGGAEGCLLSAKTSARSPSTAAQKEGQRPNGLVKRPSPISHRMRGAPRSSICHTAPRARRSRQMGPPGRLRKWPAEEPRVPDFY